MSCRIPVVCSAGQQTQKKDFKRFEYSEKMKLLILFKSMQSVYIDTEQGDFLLYNVISVDTFMKRSD